MGSDFFPTRALLWSFWGNIVFVVGMVGYLLMDGFDYKNPNALGASLTASIYAILASVFVVDSTFQVLSLYYMHSSTHRYYIMIISCIFDKVGSYSYFIGALLTAIAFKNSNTIWTFNLIGVSGFVVGAAICMLVRGPSILSSWANIFNLVGSLLYLLAFFVTLSPLTQILVIIGDVVYLIDAILYTICWFSERQLAQGQGEDIPIVHK
jgi:hypothetical protein